MGTELNIARELGNISATAMELCTLVEPIKKEISHPEFLEIFDKVISGPIDCYRLLQDKLQPILVIDSQETFTGQFDECFRSFRESYQTDASKPRNLAEASHEHYFELQRRRETRTSYPILKYNFSRLKDFVDKWIDNDSWLAMSIDSVFKQLNKLFADITEIKQKDAEQAYVYFCSIFVILTAYNNLISQSLALLQNQASPVNVSV